MGRMLLAVLLASVVATPVVAETLREQALEAFKPLPSTIPSVKDSKITPGKIELGRDPPYVSMFEKAFPGEKDAVTFDDMAKAIDAYEATLVTPAPFDAFLNGDDSAITEDQKRTASLCSWTRAARPAIRG